MARRAALGGFSIGLFGSSGVSDSAFSIASQSQTNESYLALTRVETDWQAGRTSNDAYLAAMAAYAASMKPGSAQQLNQLSSLESTTYRIERNVMEAEVEAGRASSTDMLNFDLSKLSGIDPNSLEYLDRIGRVYSSQNKVMSEEEQVQVDLYGKGMMTTTQLREWYTLAAVDPRFSGNNGLLDSIAGRISDLDTRVVDERDAKVVSDYSDGKMTPTEFLAYAGAARARYPDGTQQASSWDGRIDQATDAAVEDDLSYRYTLSQDYLRLKQFVDSNKAPTSTTRVLKGTASTRTVLGADGNWKVVTTRTGAGVKTYAPSKAEQAAWAARQVEIAAATKQMAGISSKIGALYGGFVSTADMAGYYKKQLGTVAKGSSEWYAIQSRIDGLNAAAATESLLAKQGLKLTFPKVGSELSETYGLPGEYVPKAKDADASGMTIEKFMAAVAHVESGGRYDAVNKTTGAYGKYQILPSNWSSYAQKAGLSADAQPTPENQEIVALSAFTRYFQSYDGDWTMMAAAWHAGVSGASGGSSTWGPNTRNYVSNVMAEAGTTFEPARPAGAAPTPGGGTVGSGGGTGARTGTGTGTKTTPPPVTTKTTGLEQAARQGITADPGKGKLTLITGWSYNKPLPVTAQKTFTDKEGVTGTTRRATGEVQYDSQVVTIPKGLDAAQFKKIYSAIEKAFKDRDPDGNAPDSAQVTLGPGQIMQVFIGQDADERIGLMRDLDNSRIQLAEVEAKAYKGTRSEAAKSQAVVTARRAAAGHELLILDFAGKSGGGTVAPVATGIRILDTIVDGITSETAAMNDAWKRGDSTGAYLHAQRIQELAKGASVDGRDVGDLGSLKAYVDLADARIAQIVNKGGGSVDQLLAGSGSAGSELQRDLARLDNVFGETQAAAEPGSQATAEMDNFIKKDGNGNVVWKGTGPRATVAMKDNVIAVVSNAGAVKWSFAREGIRDDNTKGPMPPDKTVLTMLKNGTDVVAAYAPYTIEKVGYALVDGKTQVPIFGKAVQIEVDSNSDGVNDTTSTFYENPMKPGRWSSSPIVFVAPKGTRTVYAAGSTNEVLQFDGGKGSLYTLILDPKSGVYSVTLDKEGNLGGLGSPTAPTQRPLGTGKDNAEAQAVLDMFTRDLSNVPPSERSLSNESAPALGFTPTEWAVTSIITWGFALKDLADQATLLRAGMARDPMADRGRSTGVVRDTAPSYVPAQAIRADLAEAARAVLPTTKPTTLAVTRGATTAAKAEPKLVAVKPTTLAVTRGATTAAKAEPKPTVKKTVITPLPKSATLANQRGLQTAVKSGL